MQLINRVYNSDTGGLMTKTVYGKCALCTEYRRLLRSHYLGRSVQRLVQRLDEGSQVIFTPKVIAADNRQLWRHLFCSECEERFNKGGETIVLRLVNRGKDFPLLSRLDVALTESVQGNLSTYSGSATGVDTESLTYYALSLMFKGAACKWRTLEGQTTSIDLKEFHEPFRQYLLGRAPFPNDVYVILTVCTDYGSQRIVWAPFLVNGSKYRMFEFVLMGLCFHVITDKNADKTAEQLCCFRSEKKIIHRADRRREFIHAGRHICETARVANSLIG